MKRVLHISKYYYPFVGGVEQIARDCVLALNGKVEQKVLCFDHNPKSKDSIDSVDGVEVVRVGQQALVSSQALGITYGKQMKKVLRSFKPDVIIFHYPNPYVAHYLLKYINSESKLVVWWHLDIIKQKFLKHLFTGQNKRILKRADKIVATSPNYIVGSPWLSSVKKKCVVIPNCIDENRLSVTEEEKELAKQIKAENKGKILCLAVGRHVPYKGFEYLIEASKYLDDRFVIQITGKGPLTEKLHEQAKNDSKIKFLGLVSDKELKARLLSCDIYTFSSVTKNEAFGLALAEGMYFGHPAVTFTIPGSGVNYVSVNGETGIEVPNRDAKAFANALTKLADNFALRKQYGIAARIRVEDNFMFKQFKNNVEELVVEL
ncbi:glycosyltransferase [Lactobacillus porci]|uniref:glycosyltransferase n=1 Tax=Lactobacillus porci TaxID=2012477 RepID=UPI003991C2E8